MRMWISCLSLVLLTGCFGRLETTRCVYNAQKYYFRCHTYVVDKEGPRRTSKSWNIQESKMGGSVCVPAKEWPEVYSKIVEAWENCRDRNCF